MEKLTLENGEILPDPYNISNSLWLNDVKLWPGIAYPDIYNYFVNSASFYTNNEIKCYKAMDSYQYFVCGHVQQVKYFDPGLGGYVYLMADVLPSKSKATKKDMYSTYLIVSKEGTEEGQIHTAHCTCMAGSGKACSHAAAIAYKIEAAIRFGLQDSACTSSLCKWNDMSKKKAQPALLKDIDFKKPKYGEDVRAIQYKEIANIPSTMNIDLDSLRELQPAAVLFSCTDVKEKPVLPLTIFDEISLLITNGVTQDDMISYLGANYNETSLNTLEQMTIKQSSTDLWYKHRRGRITSSKMHRFFTLLDITDRKSALKEIINSTPFSTEATKYGINNEKKSQKNIFQISK